MKQVINHKSVAAVVVTYNRIEMLKQCIDHLKRQSYKLQRIYVIDNASTEGTYEEFCKKEDIAYYRLAENEGGSGGFYCGIKKAYEDGYDYIWGMDDDAFPSYDALCKIMEQVNRMSKDVCFWSNCDEDIEFKDNVKEVNEWMFVGFFLPRKVVQEVGLPRKDFFIYYDDFEYADRIIKKGYHILKVRDSIITHKSVPEKAIMKIKLGKKIVNVTAVPKQKWRAYYWIRNDILRFPAGDRRKVKAILIRCPRKLGKTILFRPQNIPIVIKGIMHGLEGKSGKYIEP